MTVNVAGAYLSTPPAPRSLEVQFLAPGQEDFLFSGRGSPRILCLPGKRALRLDWALSHNRVDAPLVTGTAAPRFDNTFEIVIPTAELTPGFFDLRVTIRLSDHETADGRTTFGWRHENMLVHPLRPAAFEKFWSDATQKLNSISPKPSVKLERSLHGAEIGAYNLASASLPESYDPDGQKSGDVEIHRVHFASHGGQTIEGWFCKPPGAGPFPGLLVLPGGGNNPRPAPVEHARHGYAALDIQVHGEPVDAQSYSAVPDDRGAAKPEQKTHFPIYLHALQAARVLKTLPGVDQNRLALIGGSQGGRLTLVVAALDPSFHAAIPAITHFSYMPWLRWTDEQNAQKSAGKPGFRPVENPAPGLQVESYFDVLNFAPRVHCPVLMNAGLIDRISPPTGVYAAFDAIAGEKELIAMPNIAHDWTVAFDQYAWRWLEKMLARKPASK